MAVMVMTRQFGAYGNDILDGGNGDDRLTGAGQIDSFVIDMEQGEIDVLTGGAGKDTFTLGGGNNHSGYIGSFYLAAGNSDYALITDFNKDEDKLSIQRPLSRRYFQPRSICRRLISRYRNIFGKEW